VLPVTTVGMIADSIYNLIGVKSRLAGISVLNSYDVDFIVE